MDCNILSALCDNDNTIILNGTEHSCTLSDKRGKCGAAPVLSFQSWFIHYVSRFWELQQSDHYKS